MSIVASELVWLLAGTLGLGGVALSALYLVVRLRAIEAFGVTAEDPAGLPSLSVVLAARNQVGELAGTVESYVDQGYPALQLVVVDDRSTDGMGAVADELARRYTEVEVLHLTELPVGWLGKVHALDRGLAVCRGELVLFTDVDTTLTPGTLAAATSRMQRQRLDHLAILPWVVPATVGQAVLSTMVRTGIVATWPTTSSLAADGGQRAYAGFGPFNMVRRSSFLAGKGFAHIKLELLDDMAVGLLMSEPGLRSSVLASQGDVAFAWYPSLPAMWRGLEKNLFVGLARLSYARAAGVLVCCALAPLLPLAAAHPLAWQALWPMAVVALACHGWYVITARTRLRERWWAAALLPLGLLLFVPALLRSCLAFWLRGGVMWSGTLYPAQEVRRGKRVWR